MWDFTHGTPEPVDDAVDLALDFAVGTSGVWFKNAPPYLCGPALTTRLGGP